MLALNIMGGAGICSMGNCDCYNVNGQYMSLEHQGSPMLLLNRAEKSL